MTNEQKIWERLMKEGYNAFATSGIMGNLFDESGLKSNNLQDSFNDKLKMTDEAYTDAVNKGTYKNFVNDSAGYGLAQWTYYTRKQALYDYLKGLGKSIDDLDGQLDFLCMELKGYTKVISVLNKATSVKEASDIVLTEFECPKDMSTSVKNKRASYAQVYYDKYAKSSNVKGDVIMSNSSLVNCTVLSPNKNSPRNHAIDTLTPHCVVGQLGAEAIGGCFTSSSRAASCNYGIGTDGRVVLCVDEKDRSWCTSSSSNDHRAITIECASDKTAPYAFNDKVYNKLIELCIDICKRYGKTKVVWLGSKEAELAYTPKSNEMLLTAHRWFANKSCPGDWLYSRYGELADKINAGLGTSTNSPASSTPSTAPSNSGKTKFAKGDVVNFKGTKHYTSSTGNTGSTCKPGKATITAVAAGKAHPYHVVAVKGEGSTVYGWVNESDLAAIESGSSKFPYSVKVKVPDLNIRKGPGTNTDKIGKYTGIGVFTIVDEADGPGASKWGLLKSYEKGRNGWISLDSAYCERV